MESPAWMFTKALSHRQKVYRLYKRALREVDNWHGNNLLEARYHKVIMRARFDANKDVKDMRQAQILLADGCRQLWEKRHFKPFFHPLDPGGSSYDRAREAPDYVCFCSRFQAVNFSRLQYVAGIVDYPNWTNVEKEQFPYYFNRREQRKEELLKHWEKIEQDWDAELQAIQKQLPESTSTSASAK